MPELVHKFSTHLLDDRGHRYGVAAYGAERADGTWTGWLEFTPLDHDAATLKTGAETSQPTRAAVEYWASGLEPVYLDGAFARAQGKPP